MTRKKCWLQYTVLFLIICLFGFCAFLTEGKSFIWKSDGYRQYYPVLQYLGEYYREIVFGIFHGDFSIPMMDYTIGQGEDILTTFANYGFGDPLTLFSALVPGKYTEYLYGFLVLFRLYLSGAAFLLYTDEMKLERNYSIYGALAYVFCGYAIWSIKDPFFLNAMIYLPLIFLGIERVMRRKGILVLVFSVLFSITSSYYFFYMTVIGAVCYFVVRCQMRYEWDIRKMFREGLRCLMVALGGVLLSGVVFLPAVYGYLQSSRTQVHTTFMDLIFYDMSYYKNALIRLFAVTENDDAGAVAYLSMSVLIFVALFVLFRKKDRISKVLKNCVVIALVAVASPFVGYIFNGFGYVTNRFMFLPAFLFSLVLVVVLPELLQWDKKELGVLRGVAIGYVLICSLLSLGGNMLSTLVMVFFLTVTIGCFQMIKDRKQLERMICGLFVVNLIININLVYQDFGANMIDAYMKAGTGYSAYTSDSAINTARKLSQGLERIDVMEKNGENPNQSVVADYHGVSVYYSVINSGYARYMMLMENAPDLMFTHRMLGNDGRAVLENLSNVKYVVSKKEDLVPYGFEKVEGEKNLYQNTLQTSIGYTYDAVTSWRSAGGYGEPLRIQNLLLEAAVIEEDSELRFQTDTDMEYANLPKEDKTEINSLAFDMTEAKHFDWVGGMLNVNKKNGEFRISFERKPNCEYYLRLDGLELIQSEKNSLWANVKMGKQSKSFVISDSSYDFYLGRNNYMICLGTRKENNETNVDDELIFRINGPAKYTLNNIELLEVPLEKIAGKVEELNEESLQDVEIKKNGFTGKLQVSQKKILCLAVPYTKGYTLYVDGKETVTDRVNGIYTGAVIPEGEHQIEMKYVTPWLKEGSIFSVLGILYVIFLHIWFKRHSRKKNK